ncbi:protein STPG4-like [Ptychodera flava]|uniref:protein STPG4-like n=1 Tax=Ptychodera flava TaxID=63121 RepID=UPI00396AADAE
MAPEATATGKQGADKTAGTDDAAKTKKAKKGSKKGAVDKPPSRRERTALKDGYEEPVSGREDWWRTYIRETPVPGSYDTKDFLEEMLEKKPKTYSFKSEGRKRELAVIRWRQGETLLPGAYNHRDLPDELDKTINTYAFRDTHRYRRELPGQRDKDCNVAPPAYKMEDYLTVATTKAPSKHAAFKDTSQRFPTIYFKANKNPAPGQYNYKPPKPLHPVSSSFKSRTPRFSSSHTKVPGPGTYEKTFQSPMPSTIAKMGRAHGLFFTSAFQT